MKKTVTLLTLLWLSCGLGYCGIIFEVAVISGEIVSDDESKKNVLSELEFIGALKNGNLKADGIISIKIENDTITIIADHLPGTLEGRYSERLLVHMSDFKFQKHKINRDEIRIQNFTFSKFKIQGELLLNHNGMDGIDPR